MSGADAAAAPPLAAEPETPDTVRAFLRAHGRPDLADEIQAGIDRERELAARVEALQQERDEALRRADVESKHLVSQVQRMEIGPDWRYWEAKAEVAERQRDEAVAALRPFANLNLAYGDAESPALAERARQVLAGLDAEEPE